MSEADDKRELLRLKQGLIEESEIIKQEKTEYPELHGKKKVENFFYHYKTRVICITLAVFAAVFITYDILSRETPDVKVIVCTSTSETKRAVYLNSDALEAAFGELCEDYNGDGRVYAEVFTVDVTQDQYTDPNTYVANSTRLFGEMQSGTGQLLVGDLAVFYDILGTGEEELDFLTDLSAIYPESSGVTIHDKFFYKVSDSMLIDMIDWSESPPDDLYLAVRIPGDYGSARARAANAEFHARALAMLDKVIVKNP